MTDQRIEPHKVTKPIQLLAAWLVGLILTNGIFLTTALKLEPNSWERGALVISSIINVPVFLLALFILQTRFRAELQEDTYYSEYLSKKTATVIRIDKNATQDARLDELEQKLLCITERVTIRTESTSISQEQTQAITFDWTEWAIALNDLHPRFSEIRLALRSADIPLATIFGSSNVDPPKKWIISLSYDLPTLYKIHLLKVLLPFGFDGIQLWEPVREAEENEDVYIGGYGEESYAKITPELESLVSTEVEEVDLIYYYKNHKIKFSS